MATASGRDWVRGLTLSLIVVLSVVAQPAAAGFSTSTASTSSVDSIPPAPYVDFDNSTAIDAGTESTISVGYNASGLGANASDLALTFVNNNTKANLAADVGLGTVKGQANLTIPADKVNGDFEGVIVLSNAKTNNTYATRGKLVSVTNTSSGTTKAAFVEAYNATIDGSTPSNITVAYNVTGRDLSNITLVYRNNGSVLANKTGVPSEVGELNLTIDSVSSDFQGVVELGNQTQLLASNNNFVTVTGTNSAPTARAPNEDVDEQNTVQLDGSQSSDPDGDSLRYQWTQITGPTVSLSNATSPTPTFTAPEVSSNTTMTFNLTVSDGSLSDTTQVMVEVNDTDSANSAPTARALDYSGVPEGVSVELNASASSDPDGDSLSFTWTQTGGPNVTLSDGNTATPAFTTPDTSQNQTYTFEVTVSDGSLNDTATATVEVVDGGGSTSPVVYAPGDSTYDPTKNFILGVNYDTAGQVAPSDASVVVQNVTDNTTFLAANSSLTESAGTAMVELPASELSGDVTLRTVLVNTTSGTELASDLGNYTASSGGSTSPAVYAPGDDTYDPTKTLYVGIGYDTANQIATEDIAVEVTNRSAGGTILARNASLVQSSGQAFLQVPASALSGDVTLGALLVNNSSRAVLSSDEWNLTADSGSSGGSVTIGTADSQSYDPSADTKVAAYIDATGVISQGDVGLRVLNASSGTVVASNTSGLVNGTTYVTIPAGTFDGNQTIAFEVYNTSEGATLGSGTTLLVDATSGGGGTSPVVDASDKTYDPTTATPIRAYYDASPVTSTPGDVTVEAYNVTNGNNTLIASNSTVSELSGYADLVVPDGRIDGTTGVELRLKVNGTVTATDVFTLAEGTGTGEPYLDLTVPSTTSVDESVTLDVFADDSDGTIVAYNWTITAPDGQPEYYNRTSNPDLSYTPTMLGTYTVSVSVTDDSGNTVTETRSMEVTKAPVVVSSSVTYVSGAKPDMGNITLRSEFSSGLLQVQLRNGSYDGDRTRPGGNYELEGLGVEDDTRLRIDTTVSNFVPRVLIGSAHDVNWTRTRTPSGNWTITITGQPAEVHSYFNSTTGTGPDTWNGSVVASQYQNQTITYAVDDLGMLSGSSTQRLNGTVMMTDSQRFSTPSYNDRVSPPRVELSVAAPHFETDGSTVNEGFFEAYLPPSLLSDWGVTPSKLVGVYNGQQRNADVTATGDGGARVAFNVTYSEGTASVTYNDSSGGDGGTGSAPTIESLSVPSTATVDTSQAFDAAASDEDDIQSYAWTVTAPSGAQTTLNGQSVSFTPTETGDYDVTLVVTDNNGTTTSRTVTMSVSSSSDGGGDDGGISTPDAPYVEHFASDLATQTLSSVQVKFNATGQVSAKGDVELWLYDADGGTDELIGKTTKVGAFSGLSAVVVPADSLEPGTNSVRVELVDNSSGTKTVVDSFTATTYGYEGVSTSAGSQTVTNETGSGINITYDLGNIDPANATLEVAETTFSSGLGSQSVDVSQQQGTVTIPVQASELGRNTTFQVYVEHTSRNRQVQSSVSYGCVGFAGSPCLEVASTSVTYANGSAVSGVSVNTEPQYANLGVNWHLHPTGQPDVRDISGVAGVSDSTELTVSLTVDNLDPIFLLGTANAENWTTTRVDSNTTRVTVTLTPAEANWDTRIKNPDPIEWPLVNGSATTTYGAIADMTLLSYEGQIAETTRDRLRGAMVSTDAQAYLPPTYSSGSSGSAGTLKINVANPHYEPDGKTVATGFYRAIIPQTVIQDWGVTPSQLTATYQGKSVQLSVEQLPSGNVAVETPLSYSAGTVTVSGDSSLPSVSNFDATSPSEGTVEVSFDVDRQLIGIGVDVTGPESTTLTRGDFTETDNGDGTYTYTATLDVSTAGTYEAVLKDVQDQNGKSIGTTFDDTADVAVSQVPDLRHPPEPAVFGLSPDKPTISTPLTVISDKSITFDNGNNYELEFVRNGTTAFTATVPTNVTFAADKRFDVVLHATPGWDYTVPALTIDQPSGPPKLVNLTVTSGSVPSHANTTESYSLRLLNASTGQVVDTTDPTTLTFDYTGELSANTDNGTTRFTIPQSVLPDSVNASLLVYEPGNRSARLVEDATMTLDASNDVYYLDVPADSIDDGLYDYQVSFVFDDGTELDITSFSTGPVVVGPAPVSGTVTLANGETAPAGDFVVGWPLTERAEWRLVSTDSDGSYALPADTNAEYALGYYQQNDRNGVGVQDGSPDLYTFAEVNTSTLVKENVTLPDAYNVTITVEDSDGDPVSDDVVDVGMKHYLGDHGSPAATRLIQIPIREDGTLHPLNGSSPWELVGNVSLTAVPEKESGRFTENVTRNITVTGPQSVTITLPEEQQAPSAAVTANASSVFTGDSVLLSAADSTDNVGVASASWTVTGPNGGTQTFSGLNATVTLDTGGDYDVSVTVTDVAGNTDTASTTLSAQDPASVSTTFSFGSNVSDGELASTDDLVVTASVVNDGDVTTDRTVELVVDGQVVTSQTVTLAGGESKTVTFRRSLSVGVYDIGVAGAGTNTVEVYEPASLSVDGVVSETDIFTSDLLEVQATVTNDGGTAGTKQVALAIDGTTVKTANVTVAGGNSKTVTLTHRFSSTGQYDVEVNDAVLATVRVRQASNPDASVSVDAPATGAVLDDTVTVDYSVSNTDSGISDVVYRVDGGSYQTVTDGLTTTTLDLSGLSEGEHSVTVALRDNLGNVISPSAVTFEVDTSAPTVSVSGGDTVVGPDQTATVNVTVSDETLNATSADLVAGDGTVVETVDLTDRAADGQATVTVDASNASGALSTGTYTLRVTATDEADQSTTASTTVDIDTDAPTASGFDVSGLTANDYLNASGTLSVSGDVSDTGAASVGNATVVLVSQDASYNATSEVAVDVDKFSTSLSLADSAPAGDYAIAVRVTDAAGNAKTTTVSQTFTYDATAPTLGVSVSTVNATHGRVTVTASEQLASAPSVTVTGPSGTERSVTVTKAASGTYNTTFRFSQFSGDGSYTAEATGSDLAGQSDTATSTTTVQTSITVNAGSALIETGDGTFINLSLTTDSVSGAVASLTASDTPLAELASDLTGSQFIEGELGDKLSQNLSYAEIGIPTADVSLPPGVSPSQIELRRYNETTDTWENVGTTTIENRTVAGTEREYFIVNVSHFSTYGAVASDTEAPTIDSTSLTDGLDSGATYDYGTDTVTTTVAYSDDVSGVNASAVEVTFDGTPVDQVAGVTADVTSSEATVTATGLAGTGSHSVKVTAVDETGKTNSTTATFTVETDTTAPTLDTAFDNGTVAYGTDSQSIRVNYSDALSGVDTSSVTVTVDGSTLSDSQTTVDDGYVSFDVPNLSPGDTKDVTVAVSDADGNTASIDRTFTVQSDSAAPTVDATTYTSGGTTVQPTFDSDTTSVTAELSISDDLAGVNASAVEVEFGETGSLQTVTDAALVTQDTVEYTATDLTEGTDYELKVTLVDEDGNTDTVTKAFSVGVDNAAPVVSTTTFSPSGTGSPPAFEAGTDSVSIDLSVSDATGLNASETTVMFGPKGALSDVTADATITDDTVTLDAVGLQNDTLYELEVTLADDASPANTATVTKSFAVNASTADSGDGTDDGSTDDGTDDTTSDDGGYTAPAPDDGDDGGQPAQPPTQQPAPSADIAVVSQSLTTDEIAVGETASVTVTLTNDGDASGTKTVTLSLDGTGEASTTYTLDAGATETVTLYASPDAAGEYAVQVEGTTVGTLTVTAADDEQTTTTTTTTTEDDETTTTTTTTTTDDEETTTTTTDAPTTDDETTAGDGSGDGGDGSSGSGAATPGFTGVTAIAALLAAAVLALRVRE